MSLEVCGQPQQTRCWRCRLWRLADAHARDTFRTIVGVDRLGAATGPGRLVPGDIRKVVGWIRGIRRVILVRGRMIVIVGLLLLCIWIVVWIVVGHSGLETAWTKGGW